jgi:ABC-2 type transport system permease protein
VVAQFLRLKLQLTVNLFRRSPWQVVAIVFGMIYGLGILGFAVLALFGLRFAPVNVAQPIVVLIGSVVVLGFLIVPLLLGTDDTLDPKRFALFGIERSKLAVNLALAALVGIPTLVLTLVCLATLVTWSRSVWAVLVGIVAAAATVAICTLVARISATGATLLLATRRSREWVTGILVLCVALISPLVIFIVSLRHNPGGLAAVVGVTDALGWTPLGASWSAPASIAAGNALGLLQLLVALASVGLLWLAWRAVLARALVTPARQGRVQTFKTLGSFRRFRATPTGAVAARSMTYWARDMRYRVAIAVLPLTPIIIIGSLLVAGAPANLLALVPVPTVILFLGWSGHNDVAYDGTAIWLHVVSGVPGRADRIGRAVPILIIGVPFVLIGSIVCAVLYGDFTVVFALLGVSGGLLLTGIGFSFVASARFPYPVAEAGQSPFQQPQSTGAITVLVQMVTLFAQFVLAVPALFFAALGLLYGDQWFVVSGVVGLFVGVVIFAGGLAWGSRIFERRGPEMLASALRG